MLLFWKSCYFFKNHATFLKIIIIFKYIDVHNNVLIIKYILLIINHATFLEIMLLFWKSCYFSENHNYF